MINDEKPFPSFFFDANLIFMDVQNMEDLKALQRLFSISYPKIDLADCRSNIAKGDKCYCGRNTSLCETFGLRIEHQHDRLGDWLAEHGVQLP